jgi:sulfate transport system substrate-binding protein
MNAVIACGDGPSDRGHKRAAAEVCLKFRYTDEEQHILAKRHYRRTNEAIRKQFTAQLPELELFSIQAVAADWDDAQKEFFANETIFDCLYQSKRCKRQP